MLLALLSFSFRLIIKDSFTQYKMQTVEFILLKTELVKYFRCSTLVITHSYFDCKERHSYCFLKRKHRIRSDQCTALY